MHHPELQRSAVAHAERCLNVDTSDHAVALQFIDDQCKHCLARTIYIGTELCKQVSLLDLPGTLI